LNAAQVFLNTAQHIRLLLFTV